MQKTAIVIGSGFSGMSAASFMAKQGWQVTVLEKHEQAGGRARKLQAQGFTFDMGPSWYWMPDVFERYFAQFGKKVSNYYTLTRLNPSYRVYWQQGFTDLPANLEDMYALFDSIEKGAGEKLKQFLKEAAFKYETGINKLVYKPGRSLLEFADMDVIKGVFKLDVFTNMQKHVAKFFTHPKLRYLMEFPVLFLGALAKHTPALYSLMNYADITGGTWWPTGGMYSIVQAMHACAVEQGVVFNFNDGVQKIEVQNGIAKKVITQSGKEYTADVIISSADYHHTEQKLLEQKYRNYSPTYWDKRKMAPSSLLYYVGLNKKLQNVPHHSLFFDVDFDKHANEIYTNPTWPTEPLFYVSCTSSTDNDVAPEGHENLFFLIPIAVGMTDDDEAKRNYYFEKIVKRMEEHIGQNILEHIVYKKSFATSDFIADYNSFKGNAYGLANTLDQTAILKPKLNNNKVKNLFYTGQLTVPGPGVPPSLISGEVVASFIAKKFK
jgi:phytoene desaturase